MSVPAAEPAGGAADAPEPVTPLLEARGLCKRFPGVVALDDVSVSVRAGETHGLVGENGAGKSTLLKIVSGVYSTDDGELLWKGEPVAFKGPPEAVKRGIELIPQELDLAFGLSAAENIMMGIYPSRLGRVRWREVNRKAREIASTVHLEADLRRKCGTLSPAEQRLVMIARALARNASLVIMDEPTVALSEVEVDALKTVVRELRQNGVTVIYVSHRLDEVLELTDRVTVMKDGRVMSTEDTADVTKPRLIEQIIGRAYGEQFPDRREPASADPLLSVRNISRGFVRDISFDLRPGEILGLAGLVGSGRTEIVRMVFGADPREEGAIEMDGRPVKLKSPRHAVRLGLSLLPEDRRGQGAIVNMSIAANVSLPVLRRFAMRGTGLIYDRVETRAVRDSIGQFNVNTPSVRRPLKFLSGGNQQKTLIAKWDMSNSRVFMFDEPTAGVDVGAKQEIYARIAKLAKGGAGVIVISSELEEIVGLCHRVLVMREGRCVGELKGEAISEGAILELCYAA